MEWCGVLWWAPSSDSRAELWHRELRARSNLAILKSRQPIRGQGAGHMISLNQWQPLEAGPGPLRLSHWRTWGQHWTQSPSGPDIEHISHTSDHAGDIINIITSVNTVTSDQWVEKRERERERRNRTKLQSVRENCLSGTCSHRRRIKV